MHGRTGVDRICVGRLSANPDSLGCGVPALRLIRLIPGCDSRLLKELCCRLYANSNSLGYGVPTVMRLIRLIPGCDSRLLGELCCRLYVNCNSFGCGVPTVDATHKATTRLRLATP